MSAKGWCPGVLRPMAVEDGLLVRVKPPMSRLSGAQVNAICDAAVSCGSGDVELTSRANIQIRGVKESTHQRLIDILREVGLADASREIEALRQITVAPFWRIGEDTEILHDLVVQQLDSFPILPEKLGIAIDICAEPLLRNASADFRFERAGNVIILRADGATMGRAVSLTTAPAALREMAEWFVGNRQSGHKRMVDLVKASGVPDAWCQVSMVQNTAALQPGTTPFGTVIKLRERRFHASLLSKILTQSSALGVRLMPSGMLLLEGVNEINNTLKAIVNERKLDAAHI